MKLIQHAYSGQELKMDSYSVFFSFGQPVIVNISGKGFFIRKSLMTQKFISNSITQFLKTTLANLVMNKGNRIVEDDEFFNLIDLAMMSNLQRKEQMKPANQVDEIA